MDNQLKNKLTGFEALPPEGAWDKIAEALNESPNLSKRLYNFTEKPPPGNWNKIEKKLDQEVQPAKIIPFTTRFRRPLRYAAAASIIGIIAISTTLFMRKTEAGALQTASQTTVPATTQAIASPTEEKNTSPTYIATAFPVIIKEEPPESFKKRFLSFIQPKNVLASVAVGSKFFPKKVSKEAMFSNASLDNYMVFSDGNGMAMRMPKKLFPLVNCDDGDPSCRQRIQSLQQKLSSAALTTDFTSILEMLREMQ